jgi:hypothetical protein
MNAQHIDSTKRTTDSPRTAGHKRPQEAVDSSFVLQPGPRAPRIGEWRALPVPHCSPGSHPTQTQMRSRSRSRGILSGAQYSPAHARSETPGQQRVEWKWMHWHAGPPTQAPHMKRTMCTCKAHLKLWLHVEDGCTLAAAEPLVEIAGMDKRAAPHIDKQALRVQVRWTCHDNCCMGRLWWQWPRVCSSSVTHLITRCPAHLT